MTCSLCGEVCRCHPEPPPCDLLSSGDDATSSSAVKEDASSEHSEAAFSPDAQVAWRNELSARLDRYRARRKVRPPRYPSLRLQFDPIAPAVRGELRAAYSQSFETTSNALAMETAPREEPRSEPETEIVEKREVQQAAATTTAPQFGKILEFPRWAPPPSPPDQLAEPVTDRLRILEVPEVVPAAPALGGITIEPPESQEPDKRPGIDIPLQSAPLSRRIAASAMDALIVAAASALFGSIFWKIAGVRPPLFQILGLLAAIPCLLWAAYEYLLMVYAGATPGLRLARLELARFDGSPAGRALRRWRVLASYLSAASLGMGYAWVFLDEDVLCWHDRITHTYLAVQEKTADPTRPR